MLIKNLQGKKIIKLALMEKLKKEIDVLRKKKIKMENVQKEELEKEINV